MTPLTALVAAQHAELAKLTEDQVARAARLTQEALERMRRRLARARPDSWAEHQGRLVVREIQDLLGALVVAQGASMAVGVRRAVGIGARSVVSTLRAMDGMLGATGPLRVDVLAWVASGGAQLSGLRMRVVESSLARYGALAGQEVADEIARIALVGGTWVEARPAIEAATARVVQGRQWMVDRIARTEVAAAYNGARVGLLVAEDQVDTFRASRDRLQKKLVAVFDQKTGKDSVILHGQTVPVGNPFVDVTGREYMAPPNRPHDREIVIPWRASYGSSAAYARATAVGDDGQPAAALRRRLLLEAQEANGAELARVRRLAKSDDPAVSGPAVGRLDVLRRKAGLIRAQLAEV